jgi:hypothetical protein
MDTVNVVYIHNGVLFSHKEEQNYVIKMKLEIIMLSEISQAQNAKFHIFTSMQNLDLK